MTDPSTNPPGGAFPRRQFLKGAGAATGAFLAGLGAPARGQDAPAAEKPAIRGPGAAPTRLRVNGREHRLALEPGPDDHRVHAERCRPGRVCFVGDAPRA